ncbi:lipocalin family protein [Methylomicrobium sp. Wu6]|uniref:lipocalin family protein n=1 Tax=Methylomicrobium sp. Wu6 TaxID=3107928 RepID=UPI002DD6A037|nr:lipocalin family protein [Methylomicrobium sp. Wu6]MEC4746903.1 lipocalin family protein [Methylomicrobium sp. Wu6]
MNIFWLLAFLLASCTGIPKGMKPVDGFDVNRYVGTWYEIARLDQRFEKGLDNISAHYSLANDGGLEVLNQGQNLETGEWKKAEGKAYFIEQPTVGRLKVSFFGPFYGSYNIIALDKQNYQYSMVTGPNRSYLWILARTKTLPKKILDALIEDAKKQGFDTGKLIRVKQKE